METNNSELSICNNIVNETKKLIQERRGRALILKRLVSLCCNVQSQHDAALRARSFIGVEQSLYVLIGCLTGNDSSARWEAFWLLVQLSASISCDPRPSDSGKEARAENKRRARDCLQIARASCPYLMCFLHEDTSLTLQELSAWAIGNMLSSGDSQVADIVRACGIRSLLAQLLLAQSDGVVRCAAYSLANYARISSANAQSLRELGVVEKLQTAIALVVTTLTRSREQQLSLAALAQVQLAAAATDSSCAPGDSNAQNQQPMDASDSNSNRIGRDEPRSTKLSAQVGAKAHQTVAVPQTLGASLAFIRRPVAAALLGDCERLDAYDTLVELCSLADSLFRPNGVPLSAAQSISGLPQVEQLISTLLDFLARLFGDTRWTAELLCEHYVLTVVVTCVANLVAVWQESAQLRAADSGGAGAPKGHGPTSDLLDVLSLERAPCNETRSESGETVSEKARATALRLLPTLRRALYSSDLKRSALLLVTNLVASSKTLAVCLVETDFVHSVCQELPILKTETQCELILFLYQVVFAVGGHHLPTSAQKTLAQVLEFASRTLVLTQLMVLLPEVTRVLSSLPLPAPSLFSPSSGKLFGSDKTSSTRADLFPDSPMKFVGLGSEEIAPAKVQQSVDVVDGAMPSRMGDISAPTRSAPEESGRMSHASDHSEPDDVERALDGTPDANAVREMEVDNGAAPKRFPDPYLVSFQLTLPTLDSFAADASAGLFLQSFTRLLQLLHSVLSLFAVLPADTTPFSRCDECCGADSSRAQAPLLEAGEWFSPSKLGPVRERCIRCALLGLRDSLLAISALLSTRISGSAARSQRTSPSTCAAAFTPLNRLLRAILTQLALFDANDGSSDNKDSSSCSGHLQACLQSAF